MALWFCLFAWQFFCIHCYCLLFSIADINVRAVPYSHIHLHTHIHVYIRIFLCNCLLNSFVVVASINSVKCLTLKLVNSLVENSISCWQNCCSPWWQANPCKITISWRTEQAPLEICIFSLPWCVWVIRILIWLGALSTYTQMNFIYSIYVYKTNVKVYLYNYSWWIQLRKDRENLIPLYTCMFMYRKIKVRACEQIVVEWIF